MNQSKKKMDWEPYLEDIVKFYVTDNKTVSQTISYLHDKYGLNITEQRFKRNFPGLKNLKATEWKDGIIPTIRKRSSEGKESDVYFNGEKLGYKRVKTAADRYSSQVNEEAVGTSEVVGQSINDRIFICTPSSLLCSPQSMILEDQQRHSSADDDASGIFANNIQYTPQEPTPSDRSLETSRLCLTANLPWFEMNDMISEICTNVDLYSEPFLNPPSPAWFADRPSGGTFRTVKRYNTDVSADDSFPMLCHILGISGANQVVNLTPTIAKKFHAFIPQRHTEEPIWSSVLLNPSQRHPIWYLFQVAAYFASNTILKDHQTEAILKWVSKNDYTEHLNLFLKLNLASVRSFGIPLLRGAIKAKNVMFLRTVDSLEVHFDEFREKLMKIKDLNFLKHVLSRLNARSKEGQSGGRLLRRIAKTPYIDVAKYLIEAGADVNITTSEDARTQPLWEAVSQRSLKMVQCLLEAGAKVDALGYETIYFLTALDAAVGQMHISTSIVECLLDHGARIETLGDLHRTELINYLEKLAPRCRDLVLAQLRPNETTIENIISAAAIDVESLGMFISGKNGVPIPELFLKSTLEESLVIALRRDMMRATINLLQYGVDPSGSHLPRNIDKPLKAALLADYSYDYLDLLIHFKVNVNDEDVTSHSLFDFSDVDHSLDVLERMVTAGLDLQRYGPQMLEKAACRGYATNDIVRFLVDNGAPINYYGLKATVFQTAACKGNLDLMKYLVDRGADCEKPAHKVSGFTALQGAAVSSDMETVQYLVDTLKVNINAAPAILHGVTTLEASVRPRNSIYSYYGNDLEEDDLEEYDLEEDEDDLKDVCLDDYSDEDSANTFTFLLGKGAEVNRVGGSPSPLLHDLIERRLIDLLRLALEKGAQFEHSWGTNSSLECERTPIQLACETLQLDAVKQLFDFGANLNAPPARDHGRTALQAAVSARAPDIELVKFLLSKGANVNAQVAPIGGITALQGAAIKGHINIVSLLIEEGADVNAAASSSEGRTAIDGAAEHGRLDVVQMLLNAGASSSSSSGFENAINLARKNHHLEIVKLLETRRNHTNH